MVTLFIFLRNVFGISIPKSIQIRILEKMLDSYQKSDTWGLCNVFVEFQTPFFKNAVEYYIPLFTRENANKHCDGEKGSAWWWNPSFPIFESDKFKYWERNTEPRIKFLNWCISELKK